MKANKELQKVINDLAPARSLKQKLFRLVAVSSGYVVAALFFLMVVLGVTMVALGGLSRGYIYAEKRLFEEANAAYYSSVDYLAKEHGYAIPTGVIEMVTDDSIEGMLKREMKVNGLPEELFPVLRGLVWVESQDNAFAVSKANAAGLMQLMPDTVRKCGLPDKAAFSRKENIQCGTWWFKKMMDSQKNDVVRALTEYNAGASRMYQTPESKDYAGKVMRAALFREWES